jgi:hypothetical protein
MTQWYETRRTAGYVRSASNETGYGDYELIERDTGRESCFLYLLMGEGKQQTFGSNAKMGSFRKMCPDFRGWYGQIFKSASRHLGKLSGYDFSLNCTSRLNKKSDEQFLHCKAV